MEVHKNQVRTMRGERLNDSKRAKDLILMLGFNETTDQLALGNSVMYHGHVLNREDGNVLRREFEFQVEDQKKKGRLKKT